MTTQTQTHQQSSTVSEIILDSTHIDPDDETKTELRWALLDTQGNILKGHGRNHGKHLFIRFAEGEAGRKAARDWLARTADDLVTSTLEQWQDSRRREDEYRAAEQRANPQKAMNEIDKRGRLFVNLLLSSAGYEALGLRDKMPDSTQGEGTTDNFRRGAKHKDVIAKLNDPPPDEWQPGFNQRLDALVIVAHDSPPEVNEAVDRIKASLGKAGRVVHEETGVALRFGADKKTYDPKGPIREHFGFLDGVSQPQFFKKEFEKLQKKHGKKIEYDPSARLKLVLTPDPGQTRGGFGSFFVYRKLQQNVHKFHADRKALAGRIAKAAGADENAPTEAQIALAGAYIIGRFPDGTPVVKDEKPGAVTYDNNFEYQKKDRYGYRCPYSAHTRKVNPREGDHAANKIARRGMSFGPATLTPKPDDEVGLLFLCAQASIEDQFEVLQGWSIDHAFPETNAGRDPIVNLASPRPTPDEPPKFPQPWPKKYNSKDRLDDAYVGDLVTLRGAEYFFAPSLSFLRSMGGATNG